MADPALQCQPVQLLMKVRFRASRLSAMGRVLPIGASESRPASPNVRCAAVKLRELCGAPDVSSGSGSADRSARKQPRVAECLLCGSESTSALGRARCQLGVESGRLAHGNHLASVSRFILPGAPGRVPPMDLWTTDRSRRGPAKTKRGHVSVSPRVTQAGPLSASCGRPRMPKSSHPNDCMAQSAASQQCTITRETFQTVAARDLPTSVPRATPNKGPRRTAAPRRPG